MELRAFAEQVLFASSLGEKLCAPDNITDESPGAAIVVPAMPGRPVGLTFKQQGGSQNEFPGTRALEKESERGRLLHFFANHELLATELMALVLLRFPDAPPAFRRGVLQTLRDEQEHTRLYLERMRVCGVEFGDLPVSGYFWRAISGMECPMDYVAGLSLTFEQANLDFAQHFARTFAEVGDAASAGLLEQIHRDEIAHVAYGLKWFRRWKNPTESDWDAFCRQLKFPLSPQRAKGGALNVASRRAAGLDAQFIAELDVFTQSKGRTPGVYLFNPFAEGHLAQGRAFNPAKHQRQLARDLETLPQFLCRPDDVVLVEQRPSVGFLSGLKQAGLPLPEFLELGADDAGLEQLAERKLGGLHPWAWSPDSLERLEPLRARVAGGESEAAMPHFSAAFAALYSKAWSAAFLRRFMEAVELGDSEFLCSLEDIGVSVNSLDEALAVIAAIRSRGHHRVVVKESLGLAGSNAIRLWEPDILDAQRRWMAGVLERGHKLVIEPWLERVCDFSIQFEMKSEGLSLVGYTGLINDARGQFQANYAESRYTRRLPVAVFAALPKVFPKSFELLYDGLREELEPELHAAGFRGPLGVDAFAYRDGAGQALLKPVVEINPRYTMGRLTLELMKHVAPGCHGTFRLINHAQLAAMGFDSFVAYAEHLGRERPVRLQGEPRARICDGAVCLTEPVRAQVCLAVFDVTPPVRKG